jgi:hypothetical protein
VRFTHVALVFRLISLRQGYGSPPKRFARRRKAEATGTGGSTGTRGFRL